MKKIYLTTTLPYINAEPHLGFALEIIQTDVLARFFRIKKYEVFFNTGTDEHGLKIFRKAKENNIDVKEYCDKLAQKYKGLKGALNLTYDNFIRTTDAHHIKAAQEFWKRCEKSGDIYKKNYKIKYCVGCELEKTESELENGKCPIHSNLQIEIIEEENYFFRYSKYQKKLLDLYRKNPDFVVPKSRLNEIESFTERGLEDFSVSRLKEKMPWGVPVPGDDKHVIFVWFDALVNYISALGWPEDNKKFKSFWPGLQMAGKDNLRQQSSMWQAMLMSSNLPNSKQIFIHGFINVNGQKMSKSLGNVIDPFELVNKYGTDAVRYYLLREIPSSEDGDFTYEKFEERYNSDLASGIGNLVSRVIALADEKTLKSSKAEKETDQAMKKAEKDCKKYLEEFKFNEALKSVWELIAFCDKYINDNKPWEKKEDSGKVVSDMIVALKYISELLYPFLPQTSENILSQIKTGEKKSLFPRLT